MKGLNNRIGERVLEERLLRLERKLRAERNASRRKDLRREINELKADLGWTLMDQGEYERALWLYRSLPWESFGETKCNGIARALTEMGFYDEARKLLEAGLRTYPDSYPLWVAMGAFYEKIGDDFHSLECFETALECDACDHSVALYNKALVLSRIGCYADAVEIVDELIERSPANPKLLMQRGCLALEMGYPQEALRYYQEAMERWQESPTLDEGISIYSGLCSVYMDLGMKKDALQIALEGLRRFPDEDPVLYHNVGAVYFEMGWKREAVEVLKKGIEKFPEDEEMKTFLKQIEDDLDDPDSGSENPALGIILLMLLLFRRMRRK